MVCGMLKIVSAEEGAVIDSTVKIAAAGGIGFTHKCQLPTLKATLRSDTCITLYVFWFSLSHSWLLLNYFCSGHGTCIASLCNCWLSESLNCSC